MVDVITTSIIGIVMLMIYSYMIKDNIFYRFAETTLTAIAIGYVSAYGINNINRMAVGPLLSGDLFYLVPIIFGLLVFTRYFSGYSYFNRWSISLVLGVGSGVALRTMIQAQVIEQMLSVMKLSLTNVSYPELIGNIIVMTGVPCVLFYFYFTREFTNPTIKGVRTYGRYILMSMFGAVFAAYITTRLSMLVDNFRFIIVDWLKTVLNL